MGDNFKKKNDFLGRTEVTRTAKKIFLKNNNVGGGDLSKTGRASIPRTKGGKGK